MPCNCDGMDEHMEWIKFRDQHKIDDLSESFRIYSAMKEREKLLINSVENILNKCSALTALLCSAGKAYYAKSGMPEDVVFWWLEHCAWDKSKGEPWDIEPKEEN